MGNKRYKRAIAVAVVGNILEWYDFVVYAFFAVYISKNFFHSGLEIGAIVKTFSVFAAAFVARPLGGFLLGAYADKKGRKNALSLTIVLMSLGVVIIAFCPGTETIGILAPIFLVVARILQGFSAGGEIGSATAFLVEYAPKEKRAFYASLFQSCMGIAAVLAGLTGLVITSFFTQEQIFDFAWRLPFILGLSIFPVGLYIRKNIDETPEFKAHSQDKKQNFPIKKIFTSYKKPLFLSTIFCLLWTVVPFVFVMFMPSYFMGLGFDKNHVFLASAVANICMVVLCPMVGALADKYGIKKMLYFFIVLMSVGNFFFFFLLDFGRSLPLILVVYSGFIGLASMFMGNGPAVVAKNFPIDVRSSGISVSYNIASLITGFVPAFLAWATNINPASLVAIFAVFALVAIYYMDLEV